MKLRRHDGVNRGIGRLPQGSRELKRSRNVCVVVARGCRLPQGSRELKHIGSFEDDYPNEGRLPQGSRELKLETTREPDECESVGSRKGAVS